MESLSEDELNKLLTVAEYRTNGISGRNGEHPFLMKGLQTVSIVAAGKINATLFSANSERQISEETALRLPTALFGTFTALLIFLLINEFFGSSIALIAAALWCFDPNAIGFDRVAKEDSFLLFFFLLGNFFLVHSQTLVERGKGKWMTFVWLTAISLGAMLASKYLVHIAFIGIAYFVVIRNIPSTKWRISKGSWLMFYGLIGVSFLIFNPTILLPETWREMLKFSSEQRIGHDSYEFAGNLYQNKITLWLAGVPWSFYYVYILVKTPLMTLFFAIIGLPLLFRRKLGDGRFFMILWIALWFLPFTFLGGKFTRYFTIAEPIVLILAACGSFVVSSFLIKKFIADSVKLRGLFIWLLPAIMIVLSLLASVSVMPYFRLYTNQIGGKQNAGFYFPHDEFYDTSTRETAEKIAANAGQNTTIASEVPYLFEFYLKKAGRNDLNNVSLSDKSKTSNLRNGDFIIVAAGRRYFSNDIYYKFLENSVVPFAEIQAGGIPSVKIYRLDESAAKQIQNLSTEDIR